MQVKASTFTTGSLGGSAGVSGSYGDAAVKPPIQPGSQQLASTGSTTVQQHHEAEVMNNPLYVGAETGGTNPLFEGNSFSDPAKKLVNLTGE